MNLYFLFVKTQKIQSLQDQVETLMNENAFLSNQLKHMDK